MKLKDIMAISGEPGLFRFIAQGKNAIIVEHIETGKRSSAFASAKVSSLEEISVFTEDEDLPLGKVFDRIFDKENGGPAVDSGLSAEKLKKYFSEVIPEYSRERVYVSDIKKIVRWYNILHKTELLIKDDPDTGDDQVTAEAEGAEAVPGDGESKARSVKEPVKRKRQPAKPKKSS